jgi:predicted  nucleic acid-binding Zn-ribbon protein
VAELTDDVVRTLYSAPPDGFLARRKELADAARSRGDAAAAQAIGKLRKPTLSAWVVNAFVLDRPAVVGKLTDLGDRLRAAQDSLDAAKLRDLSERRRTLVDTITAEALEKAERSDSSAGLRDEVSGTFEAAIADADVAARLGRLQRAERWSGFGFLPTAAPQLTVVRGGREPKRATKAATKPAEPKQSAAERKRSAAERRRQERALGAAREALDAADAALADATRAERAAQDEIRQLGRRITKLQGQLEDARAELERARKDVTAARAERREARSALDRAEREADRNG